MPRQRGQRLNFQFNKGWNTEASPLTFPEGTAQDLENVILDIDGSIRRRPGVNYDKQNTDFAPSAITSTNAISFHAWENVAGAGSLAFVVTQVGTTLYFHTQAGVDTVASLVGTVSFASYATDATEAVKSVVAATSGLGYLFVVGEFIESFYVEYDFQSGSLSTTSINIQIRDFEGVDDGLDVAERPSTLSNLHEYNLRNQGWPVSFPCDSGSDPLARTKSVLGVYPSNADILGYGKVENATEPNDIGKYSPSTLQKNNFGTTPAPKGKYTFNAFDINRGTVVAGATRKYTLRRPKAVAFHNGRVFYSGVNATGYTSNVYYSQQLTDVDRVGKCYQENDPTAEEFNELLATDGGLLTIPNAGGILALAEGPAGIIVFAANGVWEITGQEGKFSATEFYVRKITDMGCIGSETVINADGTLVYWSNAGIIALQPDQITSNLAPNNLTQNTIQTGYLLIGGVQQQWARGIYVPEEKKAVWIYSTNRSYNGVNNRFKYNGFLVLDFQLGAFYKYSVSDYTSGTTPYITGIAKTTAFASTVGADPVTAEDEVVTAGGVTVTAGTSGLVGSEVEISSWKLLIAKPRPYTGVVALTFGEFSYDGFYDWYYVDGVGENYSSYIETGYDTGGMPMFDKKPTYVYCYLSRYSKSRLSGGYYNLGIGETTEYNSFCGNLSGFTFQSSKDITSQTTGPWDCDISTDGTQFLVWSKNTNGLNVYTLSTPYETSTAVPYKAYTLSSANTSHGMTISSTGLNMVFADDSTNNLYQYNLSSPWDLSVAPTYVGARSTGGVGTLLADSYLSDDGTYIYCQFNGNNRIYQYEMTTPYNITTMNLTPVGYYDYSAINTNIHSLEFDSSGTRCYILAVYNNTMYQLDLSTPWDITTATHDPANVIELTLGDTHGFCFSINGDNFYIVDDTGDYIHHYAVEC